MTGWKFITDSSRHLKDEISYLSNLAQTDKQNKISDNYGRIKHDIACTIGYLDDYPKTMSFVFDRIEYNGMLRILSRFYYLGGVNIKHYPGRKFVRPSTKDMITEQIKFCKSVGCDNYFFSREDKTPHIMMRFCKAVDFKTNENKYMVTPKDWQYVGWRGKLCLQKQ